MRENKRILKYILDKVSSLNQFNLIELNKLKPTIGIRSMGTFSGHEVCLNSSELNSHVEDVSTDISQESGVNEGSSLQHNGNTIVFKKSDNELNITTFKNIVSKTICKNIESLDFSNLKESKNFLKINTDFFIKEFHLFNNQIIVLGSNERDVEYDYKKVQLKEYLKKYNNNNNFINIYKITKKNKIKLKSSTSIEGYIETTRIINGKLFFFNQFTPYLTKEIDYSKDKKETIVNEFLIPKLNNNFISTKDKNILIESHSNSIKINSLFSINLKNYKLKYKSIISDSINDIYFNNDFALFTNIYNSKTRIFNFKISKKLSYKKSLHIEGTPLNKFAFSEFNGVLRVATSIGGFFNTTSKNYLFTIDISKNKILDSISDFGKPGETIQGIRFYKNIAYIVTFEKTDPLYTFDLINPNNIKYLGELEIPGYSILFHQIYDDRIISVGKNANENGLETGVLVQLFDCSNLNNVKLLDKLKYGKSWSTSTNAFKDQKNLLFRKSDNLLGLEIFDNTSFFNFNNDNNNSFFNLIKIENDNLIQLKTYNLEYSNYKTLLLTF